MDFFDDAHYRYILRHLESAGQTEDSTSRLRAALEAARQSPPADNGSNASNGLNGMGDLDELPTFSVSVETSDGMTFTATGEANLPEVLDQLLLTLQLYDEYTGCILAADSTMSYDRDGTVTISASGQAGVFPIPGRTVTALLTWVYLAPEPDDQARPILTGIVKSSLTYEPPKSAKRLAPE